MANTNSLLLNGTSQYLTFPKPLNDLNPGSGDFTIEGWFKSDAIGVNRIIYSSYGTSTIQKGLILIRLNAAGTARMFCRDDTNNVVTSEITTVLSADTWYHFAGTRSGNTTVFYIHDENGDLVDVDTTTGTLNTVQVSTGTFYPAIGTLSDGSPSDYFNGKIDDFRFWKGISKTQTQIEDSMLEELVGDEANLTVYLKLNNNLTEEVSAITVTNNGSATFSTDIPFGGVAPASVGFSQAIII